MKDLRQFTSTYQTSKTLRFELIPVGETLRNIQENGIIDADLKLAENYKRMKKTIDAFHKDFIEQSLSEVELNGLNAFFSLYTASAEEKVADSYKEKLNASRTALRKEIVQVFKANEKFEILGKKELIQKELKPWIDETNPDLFFEPAFTTFTTYFTGYNENRMNMYSDESKATAISYRLIDENLPMFIDNIRVFELVKESSVSVDFAQLCEELNLESADTLYSMFTLEAYNHTLSQKQIDFYNTVIGGIKTASEKHKGLNEYINLYNQTHPNRKLPKFKMLYKQILSDRESLSWLPENYENAQEMLDAVTGFYADFVSQELRENLRCVLADLPNRDPAHVYIRNDSALSDISNRIFGYYGVIKAALGIDPDKESREDYFSVAQIQKAVGAYVQTLDQANEAVISAYSPNCIADCFAGLTRPDGIGFLKAVEDAYAGTKELLNVANDAEYRLSQNEKDALKAFLDTIMDLLHFIKPLYVKSDAGKEKDELFYSAFTPLYDKLSGITKLYDMVRNFATRKPYSTEKIKLNFACNKGNLLAGWVDSKTEQSDNGTQYGGYLFRKKNAIGEYDYFLGISANTKLFRAFDLPQKSDISKFERLDYYQPKATTIFGVAYKGEKTYQERKAELLSVMKKAAAATGSDSFSRTILAYCEKDNATPGGCLKKYSSDQRAYQKLLRGKTFQRINRVVIDELKQTMVSLTRFPNGKGIAEKSYGLFTEIIEDINEVVSQKVFNYFAVSQAELDCAIHDESKPLYLFKISNQDLSYADTFSKGLRSSRGKENLHTMYFKALMSGNQNVYDLGSAEVFYRKKSISEQNKITHPANQPLYAKNPSSNGNTSTFAYDLTKDHRYTVDKFQLHLSIFTNYQAPKNPRNFNDSVCAYLRNNPDVNILGIDRGERNLLYISLIDRSGKVVKNADGKFVQYSLNTITGEYKNAVGETVPFRTPYHELLADREAQREQARENWGTIESIKELKSGYMSQVVHHIAKLMVEYNAIVVMEDLNSGFKNSRKKVEKQVYQNFEKALIEKLNYLVFKDRDPDETGGLYHALQLTDRFTGFRNLTKQSGFLFYIPAWNTSKIDPVTGFVDFLKPRYTNIPDARDFFSRFRSIRYNADKGWFEFAFDYSDFTEKAEGTRTDWTVCTHGKLRYVFNRNLNNNRGGYEKIDVTAKLRALFAEYGIDYAAGDLIPAITGQDSAAFFSGLIKLLQVTIAMRYSCAEDGADFILSPVADRNGEFYCSEGRSDGLPQDADANGAFNIARKGLYVLEQIDRAEQYRDWTTKISNKDWLQFVQTRFAE